MSDMLRQRRSLVEALYAKTSTGDVDWEHGLSQAAYSADIGDSIVELVKESDEDRIDVILTLYDKSYNTIEAFSDSALSGVSPKGSSHSSYYNLMSSLYDMARRHSTGATKAVQGVLDALGAKLIDEDDADDIPF